jgi:D-sedoheptulose 7-phosphate isomerase
VGGSAANASHAVNDFRKIAGIEAYAPTDNVSEFTARTNDEGWNGVSWLRVSRLTAAGVFRRRRKLGKGDQRQSGCSFALRARDRRKDLWRRGPPWRIHCSGTDTCVIVPAINPLHVTPHTEAFQGVVWYLIVSHPDIKRAETRWESVR